MNQESFIIGHGERAITLPQPGLFLIAGPCVIESRESALRHADRLAALSRDSSVPLVYKSSYDKANRTSHRSYRGPGLDEGLAILAEVRAASGLPVLTDVHEVAEIAAVAEVADVLQIPALLCRQTSLVQAAAATGKPVNLKKGQFLAPGDMRHAVDKARETGNRKLIVTERGSMFGYGNLVVDFRSLEILGEMGTPVVFDATHSVQIPGGAGSASSGERRFIAPLARAAVAVGVAGLFMEVHEDPDNALSDGPNSLPLSALPALLEDLKSLHEARRGGREP